MKNTNRFLVGAAVIGAALAVLALSPASSFSASKKKVALISEVTDGQGTMKYTYNNNGLVKLIAHKSYGEEGYRFTYKNGNIVKAEHFYYNKKLKPDGIRVIKMTYDQKGRLKTWEGGGVDGDESKTFSYNRKGQIVSASDEFGKFVFKYDNKGRMIKRTWVPLKKEYKKYQVNASYKYDKRGNVSQYIWGKNEKYNTILKYDSFGKVVSKYGGEIKFKYITKSVNRSVANKVEEQQWALINGVWPYNCFETFWSY